MKLFNKKEKEVKVDENGNPVENEKKKIDVKGIAKKVLIGIGCAGIGVLTFLAVGAAMAVVSSNEDEDDTVDVGDGFSTFTQEDGTETNVEETEETPAEE